MDEIASTPSRNRSIPGWTELAHPLAGLDCNLAGVDRDGVESLGGAAGLAGNEFHGAAAKRFADPDCVRDPLDGGWFCLGTTRRQWCSRVGSHSFGTAAIRRVRRSPLGYCAPGCHGPC